MYLLSCSYEVHDNTTRDLCWLDSNTIIALTDNYLIKYTLSIPDRVCSGEVLDEGMRADRISCTANGKVYVSLRWRRQGSVMVKIYDVNTGENMVWNADIHLVDSGPISVAVSNEYIVIGVHNASYVYNTDHVFLYQRTYLSWGFLDSYITESKTFWAVTYGVRSLLVNLATKKVTIGDDRVFRATRVSGSKGTVYVMSGTQLGVYSENGTFHNYLQVNPPRETNASYNAGYQDNKLSIGANGDLLALSAIKKGALVHIYMLRP